MVMQALPMPEKKTAGSLHMIRKNGAPYRISYTLHTGYSLEPSKELYHKFSVICPSEQASAIMGYRH